MNYSEAESFINNIPRFAKEKSRDGLDHLLEGFGHPEKSFSYIHVAGTNGKGSVCAYLDSILRKTGEKVGLFTSPHLVSMTERIRVDGREISEEDFAELCSEVAEHVREAMAEGYPHPTFFEWVYLMAMVWFGRQQIRFGVIEVGLGGRLDATNIIEAPALCVITSISLDHTEILGDTIEEIAGEKAGIIKPGVPVVCDGSSPQALEVIRRTAREKGSPLCVIMPDDISNLKSDGEELSYSLALDAQAPFSARLKTGAVYQAMNSALAVSAARILIPDLPEELIREGLYEAFWPARFEEIPAFGTRIYVDGAHNIGGIAALRDTLEAGFSGRDKCIVFAAAGDKRYDEMAEILSGVRRIKKIIVTRLDSYRAADIEAVAACFRKYAGEGIVTENGDIESALREGAEYASETCAMLIAAGSLYLAGSILKALEGGNIYDQF
ncbi:MAG: bifunctional folylpolyglutamate synthase/dihydrofolate synthase [Lachnospiraceae bacterium]|nr:bifunctional folylpolyglutamate synthase/dihydrofolate synthase [Lachnospiraceae bacterium]